MPSKIKRPSKVFKTKVNTSVTEEPVKTTKRVEKKFVEPTEEK